MVTNSLLVNFAHGVFGKALYKSNFDRAFDACQLAIFAKLQKLLLGHTAMGRAGDDCDDALAPFFVGCANDGNLEHAGVTVDDVFDLYWCDIQAAANDQVL